MYLKSIEVQGFKSFAHKIIFEFHNGITGIVGPNGSGKSNVADAVRWVLGEQSAKQLRGAKMEDIIFSGTENRKPQGFAYVALTIDNSDHQLSIDYEEVTVARRVYRSGESEYLINGSPCRLKDVNELFYDTGIGKEGYSIIGQGQIERILSGKPEERRELFDEAAGIVKYKRRKSEAVKKLEMERQNLIRIEDILSELEKQVGPLERQAETAREYLRLKEELKTYDINMFLLDTKSLKEQLADTGDKEAIAKDELLKMRVSFEAVKAEYGQAEKRLEETNSLIEGTRESISEAQMEKSRTEGNINLIQEQIQNIRSQEENLALRAEQLGRELQDKLTEAGGQKEQADRIGQELKMAEERQGSAENALTQVSQKIQSQLLETENGKNRIITLLNEKSNVKSKMQRYETMLEQNQIRKAELTRKVIQYKSNEALQAENIEAFHENLKSIEEAIQRAENRRNRLTERIQELHDINLALEAKRNDLQQTFHKEKSRLEALKNLTERYDGYGNSIRRVMELKSQKKGIAGVVADLIKTDKKYETAIETALGGSIQNIVTDNEQTAKELIDHLKKNKYGRATFLPLTSVGSRNTARNEEAVREAGVIGYANELVRVEKEYEGIAAYLLGRVLVADHIDNALALARKYDYSLRIVTLEGELLSAGGSMTGGAFKNAGNLLGRRREIEELEKKAAGLESEFVKARDRIDKNRAENVSNRANLEDIKKELQDAYIQKNTASMNLNRAREEKDAQALEYQELVNETREIESQSTDIKSTIQELDAQLISYEEENKSLELHIESLQAFTEKDRILEGKRSQELEEAKLFYAGLLQQTEFIRQNQNRLRKEAEKIKEEKDSLAGKKEQSQKDIKEKEESIVQLKIRAAQAEENIFALEDKLKNSLEKKDSLSGGQKESLLRREELSAQIAGLEREVYRLESQKEKLEEALDLQVHYMWDEYEMTYSEALEFRNPNLPGGQEMKQRIQELKGRIKELGTVNVNAIEDYRELSERYTFMKTQHDDLITAEGTLMKIIEELDTGMRIQFEAKFREIQLEFDKVFKELFGGGKGTLELLEDADMLEAGIRIISQPPGKKLQNMMQLSGGEKALTAIALLFAIQNLKPSPFCLLDEIEAALDDSNVGRFAKYLHKLTKNTQFIVITHRRGTMTAADRLYGITMQEKGVSTLVSVNLIEAQLDGPDRGQAG